MPIIIIAVVLLIAVPIGKVAADKMNERASIMTGNARPEPRGIGRYWDNYWQRTAANHEAAKARKEAERADGHRLTAKDAWDGTRTLARQKSLQMARLKNDELIARAAAIHRMRVAKINEGIDPDTNEPLPINQPVPRHLRGLVKDAAKLIKSARSDKNATPRPPLPDVEPAEKVTPADDPSVPSEPGPTVDAVDGAFDSVPKSDPDAIAIDPNSFGSTSSAERPSAKQSFSPFTEPGNGPRPAPPASVPASASPKPATTSADTSEKKAAEPTEAERLDRLQEARARVDDFKRGNFAYLDRKPNGEDAAVLLKHGLNDQDKELADWALQPHSDLDAQWEETAQAHNDVKEAETDAMFWEVNASLARRKAAAAATGEHAGTDTTAADEAPNDAGVHNHAHPGSVVGVQARDVDNATVVMGGSGIPVQSAQHPEPAESGLSTEARARITDMQAALTEAPIPINQKGTTMTTGEINNREDARAFVESVEAALEGLERFRDYLEGAAANAEGVVRACNGNARLSENAAATAESSEQGVNVVNAVKGIGVVFSNFAGGATTVQEFNQDTVGKINDFITSMRAQIALLSEAVGKQDGVADARQAAGTDNLAKDKALD